MLLLNIGILYLLHRLDCPQLDAPLSAEDTHCPDERHHHGTPAAPVHFRIPPNRIHHCHCLPKSRGRTSFSCSPPHAYFGTLPEAVSVEVLLLIRSTQVGSVYLQHLLKWLYLDYFHLYTGTVFTKNYLLFAIRTFKSRK